MQIQVSSRDLAVAMSAVAKVISSKNTMPILDNVLLSQKDGKYFLTGSNAENELSVSINVTVLSGDFTPVCLPVKHILPVLGSLGDQPMTLTFDKGADSYKTDVRYLQGTFSVISFKAEEYPRIPIPAEPLIDYTVKTQYLLPSLVAAQQFTANDELRPQMCSVVLDATNFEPAVNPMPEKLVIVGSDGHILYKYVIPVGTDAGLQFKGKTGKILVHKSIASAINNAMQKADTVRVYSDNKNIVFKTDDAMFVSRCVEGKYPNYNSVIPQQHSYDMVFPVKDLTSAVKRVALFSSESQLIAFKQKGANTDICAEDIDFSLSSQETVTALAQSVPDGFQIGMKSSSLLQQLSCIATDNVRMELSKADRPIIFRDDDPNSTLTLLLMPMLLNA